jgi:hypothetical protein
MTKWLRKVVDRLMGVGVDKAGMARMLGEIRTGPGQRSRVSNRGANLRLADTMVQIPAGSLPFECDVDLAPLTHGNVIAGISLACVADLRVPASWSLPKIGMRFSLRYPGEYVVVKEGKTYRLMQLEANMARRERLSA